MAAEACEYIIEPRKRFTPEEDELLKKLASDKNNKTWKEIARHLPGRTACQCRDRYNQYLFQEVVQKPWTDEEDEIIISKYRQYGPHWVKISQYLEGRSGNNIKNRWNSALKRFHNIPHKKIKIQRRMSRNAYNEYAYLTEQDQAEKKAPKKEEPKTRDINVIEEIPDIFNELTSMFVSNESNDIDFFSNFETFEDL